MKRYYVIDIRTGLEVRTTKPMNEFEATKLWRKLDKNNPGKYIIDNCEAVNGKNTGQTNASSISNRELL